MATPKFATTLFIVLFAGMLTGPRGAEAACPSGWRAYGRFCYKYFNQHLSWNGAENRCKTFRPLNRATCPCATAHLASIHSQGEQNFVYNYFKSQCGLGQSAMMWLGLNDIRREGTMEWSDGTPLNFRAWKPSQPDNYQGREDCVHMNRYGSDARWNDLPCTGNQVRHFMCKMNA
ncbi:echinoidin-like [Diadema antillarum]|uniref:echinoidin-like n=1 Tax=Diadema antillarum TaxID=105358 RepID=UPI003A872BC4